MMTAKSMKVKDFMSKYVFTVSADTTVHELVGLFITHPVSAIPVVGDDNELLGIVSEGDLLYKKVNPKIPQYVDVLGGNLYYCGFGRYERSFRKLLATTASEIMTKDVRCVTSETDMETLTTLMVDEHLKTVPVVEKKKVTGSDIQPPARLVGIITRHDILGAIAATEAEELLKNRKQLAREGYKDE
ncbi:CBS domain-containing protein [Dialister sp.]|uniref:CBS domain-containing protein n=1 Tax=Dialister sp. TaxID=1955814 RepID=UPI002E806456|nr:CBS domain-containing protein [Dialister sp.]MEE3452147.1 CBS domain-containing protein [Dialister sp.]